MFQRFHASRERREGGFTLIELLVVILIIAILAAIAIPVFLNQRKKGWESAAKSALKDAATAQESWRTDNASYATTVANLESEGYNQTADVVLTIDAGTTNADEYCMVANHASLTGDFYLDSDKGQPLAGGATLCVND
jgi:type IV pilus assembly protein PilA